VTTILKLDRAGFILLIMVTNLAATFIDGLAFLYLSMGLAVLVSVLVTGLANAIVVYLSTETPAAPPSNIGSKPVQIVPISWARLRSRLLGWRLR
jgi:hypothetical protein